MKGGFLKSSFAIVIIQAVGLIVSFLSIYLVAGDMGPAIYSLIGVKSVIVGIINTFSHLGVETAMGREALYWIYHGDNDKVQEYATQAIISRFVGFVILVPFVLAYLAFLNISKYNGQYTILFILFFIGSCVGALNQSMSIIIRSRGGYVFSQLVNTLNGDVIGVIGIFVYIYAGATPYLIFVALGTIPVMFVYISYLRKVFKLRFFLFKSTFTKIKQTRYLWLKSYMDYFRNEADSLLVSLLFPPVIMGSYTIYKRFEGIFKQFIEGFFDVLCQRQVQNKGEVLVLKAQERKINIVRWAAIGFILVVAAIFSVSPDFFICLVNLGKYDNMFLIIYTVLLVSILYLIGKYEINAISFFAPSKTLFKMGVAVFCNTIFSYLVLLVLPSIEGALLQRVISWGAASVIAIVIFRSRREKYYKNIYQ